MAHGITPVIIELTILKLYLNGSMAKAIFNRLFRVQLCEGFILKYKKHYALFWNPFTEIVYTIVVYSQSFAANPSSDLSMTFSGTENALEVTFQRHCLLHYERMKQVECKGRAPTVLQHPRCNEKKAISTLTALQWPRRLCINQIWCFHWDIFNE